MILLTATLINVHGGFVYRIEVAGTVRVATSDAAQATAALHEFGVENAEALVRHAQEWGEVEIATAEDRSLPG